MPTSWCDQRIDELKAECKKWQEVASQGIATERELRAELQQKDAELTNLKRDHESLLFLFNAHYGTEK